MRRSVDCIIVNYRTPELTTAAVRSVLSDPLLNQVIVVENASGDGSVDYLQRQFAGEEDVVIIPSPDNLGFGGGNNRGAEAATAPYLFFLNSDATANAGSLERLVASLEADSTIGVVAPAIYLDDGETLQTDALGRFPTPATILTGKGKRPVTSLTPDWVSGVAFLVRREEYLRLGGFDDRFFMYFEDIDLCRRYRKAGLTVARELTAGVVHLGGRSKRSTVRQKTQYYRSQDRYLQVSGVPWLLRVAIRAVRAPYAWHGRLWRWRR